METGKINLNAYIPSANAKVIVIMMKIVQVILFVTNVVVTKPCQDVLEGNLSFHYLTTAFNLSVLHLLLCLFLQAYLLSQPCLLFRLTLRLFQQVRHCYLQLFPLTLQQYQLFQHTHPNLRLVLLTQSGFACIGKKGITGKSPQKKNGGACRCIAGTPIEIDRCDEDGIDSQTFQYYDDGK